MASSGRQTPIDSFLQNPRPLPLRCGTQHYAWGDPHYIPRLLGQPNPTAEPIAELWIGDHPDLPSNALIDDEDVPLPVLLKHAGEALLGTQAISRFDRQLPFLLKVLAAAQPLSIQAHPNRRQAREGYRRENKASIPLDAPERSYHDDHHKPELLVALSELYALRGFRPLKEIDAVLREVEELAPLAKEWSRDRDSLITLYELVMRMEQAEVDAVLHPLLSRLSEEHSRESFGKHQVEYWLLRVDALFGESGHHDRGLFSIYLLNLLHLHPGEAVYLPDGELHAYLEGSGIEIMANSNNVLRGGLTPKHRDVDELLRILTFEPDAPKLICPQLPADAPGITLYEAPAEEFDLIRARVEPTAPFQRGAGHGIDLGILIQGRARLSAKPNNNLDLHQGDCFLVPQGIDYQIECDQSVLLFVGSLP